MRGEKVPDDLLFTFSSVCPFMPDAVLKILFLRKPRIQFGDKLQLEKTINEILE